MHSYVIGHVPENERFQEGHPLFEEVQLKPEDAFGHLVDCVLPLLDTLDEPRGGLDLFPDIATASLGVRTAAEPRHDLPVEVGNPEPRQAVVVQDNLVFIPRLENEHVRNDRLRLFLVKRAPGLGFMFMMTRIAVSTSSAEAFSFRQIWP